MYKAKFQFVELKFKGANLHVKKIKLPPKALPFKDDQLRRSIEANLRLFTDISEEEFLKPFFDLKIHIDFIRSEFLFYIKSRDKNIIKREDKGIFENELKELEKEIAKTKIELLNKLQKEINNSRNRIIDNYFEFLIADKRKEFEGLEGSVLEDVLRNRTNQIMSHIHFPNSK